VKDKDKDKKEKEKEKEKKAGPLRGPSYVGASRRKKQGAKEKKGKRKKDKKGAAAKRQEENQMWWVALIFALAATNIPGAWSGDWHYTLVCGFCLGVGSGTFIALLAMREG
jgi:hypothetical protein